MKIYICTSGEYSAYSIDAVFTDKALADQFCAKIGADIEEWISDCPTEDWEAVCCRMSAELKSDGWEFKAFKSYDCRKPGCQKHHKEPNIYFGCYYAWNELDPVRKIFDRATGDVYAKSEEAGLKILREVFFQRVARLSDEEARAPVFNLAAFSLRQAALRNSPGSAGCFIP